MLTMFPSIIIVLTCTQAADERSTMMDVTLSVGAVASAQASVAQSLAAQLISAQSQIGQLQSQLQAAISQASADRLSATNQAATTSRAIAAVNATLMNTTAMALQTQSEVDVLTDVVEVLVNITNRTAGQASLRNFSALVKHCANHPTEWI